MEDIFVGIWFLFVLTMTFLPIMCLIHVITHQFRNLKTKLTEIKETKINRLKTTLPSTISGTTVTFYPDPQIFKETQEFDSKVIIKSLKDRAYLTSKIYFHFGLEVEKKYEQILKEAEFKDEL